MKKEKKDEMGFHIRFNDVDPRQIKAARILNKVGRKKAIIVANALWDYDEDEDEFEIQESKTVNDNRPKQSIPSKPQELKPQIKVTGNNDQIPSIKESHTNSPCSSELKSSILANMGQFRGN